MQVLITGGSGFIGTHLIETLIGQEQKNILNIDLVEPKIAAHHEYWVQGDILDQPFLFDTFEKFKPTHVIHLAAETESLFTELTDFEANYTGTQNIVNAIIKQGTVKRFIHTSTQYTCGPSRLPTSDDDYFPHTVYGESKVMAEKIVKGSELDCIWTIIRPTNIWGAWHPRYPTQFWAVVARGLYVHPGGQAVVRCYGYVKNVVHQILTILDAPRETVHKEVFYVGDAPDDIYKWANGFSKAILGRSARKVPRPILRAIAFGGDIIRLFGISAPLFSSRYESMTTSYFAPMEKTLEVLGTPPVSLEQGINETVDWLRREKILA